MIQIEEYITESGKSLFATWFNNLDPKTAAKIVSAISRLAEGNFSNVKSVGSGVYERVIDYGPGYRVYFGKDGEDLIILLVGGTKKRQQLDINQAKEYWQQYKTRKNKKYAGG